jgi:hypothetical protein
VTTKISGADLKAGQTIKANGRIYTILDIEQPDWIGARLADLRTTSGEEVTINLFDDSVYELRKDAPSARPKNVKVTLPPDLAARVERARLAGETTPQAIIRLANQALDDWHRDGANG